MKKILFLSALIALSSYGCKKSSNPLPNNIPEETKAKNKLVSKTVITSATNVVTTEYTYNDKNQAITVHSTTNSSTYIPSDYTLIYNTDGTLKREMRISNGNTDYRDFTYNNGLPTLVSYVNPSNTQSNYTIKLVTNNSLVTSGTIYTLDVNGVEKTGAISKFEYSNGNVVKNTIDQVSPGYSYHSEFVYNYGTKKNSFLYSGDKFFLSSLPFVNKNELIKTIKTESTHTTVDEYTYTYDADDYPVKANVTTNRVSPNTSPSITNSTIEYTYINAK